MPSACIRDAGLLGPVISELKRHPNGTLRCRAGLRGIYLWVETPDEPNDVTATDVLIRLVAALFVYALMGYALTYLDSWLFGAAPQVELFVVRGIYMGCLLYTSPSPRDS